MAIVPKSRSAPAARSEVRKALNAASRMEVSPRQLRKQVQATRLAQRPPQRRLSQALQRMHLIFFLLPVFAMLHPGAPPLRLAWHLFAMCHALEEAAAGRKRRLVINVPPRHLKSITASVALVAWLLGRNPSLKIMVATYSESLAREHSQNCRMVMESAWYQRLFPKTRLQQGGNRQLDFRTTAGGGRRAISVTGSATGFGADIIILDDCMKADDINSDAVREELNRWYVNTLLPRLNSKKAGVIISIQQRLGEDDLTARMLEKGAHHLCLPAVAEKAERIAIGFGRIWPRVQGDLLDSQREDQATLDEMRRQIGPYVFAAQYQQNPVAPEGNIIRIEKFRRYAARIPRGSCARIVQSWDTGMSSDPRSDFSVGTTWGYRDGRYYLLHVVRQRLDYPDLRDIVVHEARRFAADKILIEDAGSGKLLLQELSRMKPRMPLHACSAADSKIERMTGQLGQIEDGLVWLPDDAPWLDAFISELRAFPYGRHDDQVDSLSHFLRFAMRQRQWFNPRPSVSVYTIGGRPRSGLHYSSEYIS